MPGARYAPSGRDDLDESSLRPGLARLVRWPVGALTLASAVLGLGGFACTEREPRVPPEVRPTMAAVRVERAPLPTPELKTQPAPAGPRLLSVPIHHSLEASLSRVDPQMGPALAQVAKRVLVWWIDVRRDLRTDDELQLLFEAVPEEEPRLDWLSYRSEKHGRRFEAVRFRPHGSKFARYYDRDGREVEARLRRTPIESYEQVTSLLGDGRRHKGVDFKAPVGTPVVAPFDGTVTRRNWSTRGNGRCVELADSKTGTKAMFLHLSQIDVRPGDRVTTGQPIARSGNTGRSTAPHLHYQLERESGRIVDPLRFHETYHRALSPKDRPALDAVWAEIDGRLRRTEG